jgi:hypothetical protein
MKVEVLPAERELTKGADALMERAVRLSAIVLKDDAEEAGTFLRGVRTRIRMIEAYFKDLRVEINEALKKNRQREKEALAPWVAADAQIAGALEGWLVAERRAVEVRNQQLLAEAEAKAAEQQQAEADVIRRAAQVAPTAKDRVALERQARQVEKAPIMPVLTGLVEAPKVAGIAIPTRKVAEVVNLKQLLRGVLDGRVPETAITLNQTWLDEQANARGKDLNFPGVVVREKTTLSARSL